MIQGIGENEHRMIANKALLRTVIPLRSIVSGGHGR